MKAIGRLILCFNVFQKKFKMFPILEQCVQVVSYTTTTGITFRLIFPQYIKRSFTGAADSVVSK